MTRVLHTGDTHVGYQQYHHPERRADFLRAFEQVITDAIDDGVDAVVHAGDLFDDRQPRLDDVLAVLEQLRRLDQKSVPFLAVVGNHDHKRGVQWLDLFESLGVATRLDETPHRIGDTAFYGLDFVPRSQRETLDYEFEPHDAARAVLVSHGLFEPFDFGDWDTERLLAESTVAFDAMLVGDNHTPGQKRIEDTLITYCGSTERASASEVTDRGYNLVTLTEETDVSLSRRSLDTRHFEFIDIELAEHEGKERVFDRLREYDLTESVVIVTIDGAGEPLAPAAIESFASDRGALIARVNDRRERETDAEAPQATEFVDIDHAVRERITELELSDAAQEIDATIREREIADANVADEIERWLERRVGKEDDPDEETADGKAQSTMGEFQ
ncbi:DNA double-strand break repair protein Mre11 [Halocatena halophila]|uniref:DNA double-strand break repair protein Mre11 n=1 Tax=Halocatena halophila TaxID=2814576 RepID=UPI002ED3FE56